MRQMREMDLQGEEAVLEYATFAEQVHNKADDVQLLS